MYSSLLRHTFSLTFTGLERPIVLLSLLPRVVAHFQVREWLGAQQRLR